MKRCDLCGGRLWPWPWSHFAFATSYDGRIYWHVRCKAAIDRIWRQEADRWEQIRDRICDYCKEQARRRQKEEDGGV